MALLLKACAYVWGVLCDDQCPCFELDGLFVWQGFQEISPFIAPEVKVELRVSCSADIYSFGVVLWYSLSCWSEWKEEYRCA